MSSAADARLRSQAGELVFAASRAFYRGTEGANAVELAAAYAAAWTAMGSGGAWHVGHAAGVMFRLADPLCTRSPLPPVVRGR